MTNASIRRPDPKRRASRRPADAAPPVVRRAARRAAERPSPLTRVKRALAPALAAEVAGVSLRLPLMSALICLALLPVALFLAGLGVVALQISGGAARDTSLVVVVAAVGVTDFWGGSIVWAANRLRDARDITIAWVVARGVLLVLVALVADGFWPLVPVMLALAAPAAWLGVRVGTKQHALRTRERRS